MARILLIDDDTDFAECLHAELQDHGHQVEYQECTETGLELLLSKSSVFDVVLLDNRMPRMTGLEFLKELKERQADVPPVILMTNVGTSDTVMEAMNLGAFDYVEKQLQLAVMIDEVEPKIREAVESKPSKPPRATDRADQPDQEFVGQSKPMLDLYKRIGRVGASDLPVLIHGETGTGKELVARKIHRYSPRMECPFLAVNSAALSETLLETELFGCAPGTITGVTKTKKGLFECADSGTLFLDEVGDMPDKLQQKLLRVLECQEIVRLGDDNDKAIKVDVRVISATHRDLQAAVEEGRFRADLFYRLNGVALSVPPLRERGSDLWLLGRHFVDQESRKANRPLPSLHPTALEILRNYAWPGNVRELQFVMRRAVWNCRGAEIMPDDLGLPIRVATDRKSDGVEAVDSLRNAVKWAWDTGQSDLWPVLSEMLERELIKYVLDECEGNQTQAAERLGMTRNTVRKRMKHYEE